MASNKRPTQAGIPPLRLSRTNPLQRLWSRLLTVLQNRAEERARLRPEARFAHLMATAHEIAQINPAGLYDLVRAIMRPVQSDHLLSVAELGRKSTRSVDSMALFGAAVTRAIWSQRRAQCEDRQLQEPLVVSLAKDIVLPWPWNHARYVAALAMTGASKRPAIPDDFPRARWRGPWKYDPMNHSVEVWLPWRIAFVSGGNHSIAAGILSAEGELPADQVYDMSFLFGEMRTNGIEYHCMKTGALLGPAPDPRIAAVFEIGRLIHEQGRLSAELR